MSTSVMLMSYVLDNKKWVQTEKLYPHDIALLLDSQEKMIYLWEGDHATANSKVEAEPYVIELKNKFPSFKYKKLTDVIPLKVQKDLERLVDKSMEEVQKFDRSPEYLGFIYGSYIGLIMMVIAYAFVFLCWGWSPVDGNPGIVQVTESDFTSWVDNAKIVLLVSTILFGVLFIISCATKKAFLIASALFSAIIQYGSYRYISLGIFLFDSNQLEVVNDTFFIWSGEIATFSGLNMLAIAIIVGSLWISLSAIFRYSIPISIEDWKAKQARLKEFKMKNVTAWTKEETVFEEIKDPRKKK